MNPPSSGGAAVPRLGSPPHAAGRFCTCQPCGLDRRGLATAAIAAYVVVCLVAGVSVDVRERDSAILIFGALALVPWRSWAGAGRWGGPMSPCARSTEERTRQAQAERELRDVARARDLALVRERDRFRNDLSREEARAERARAPPHRRRRLHAAMRDRVDGMHRQEGGEGDLDRVREVVGIPRWSCPAPRGGCCITRRPRDVGGHLDVVAAQGVSRPPREAQAERFAAEPIPAGTVIRETGRARGHRRHPDPPARPLPRRPHRRRET